MINHIINEWSKLARKEYKTRHDWVGMVIHWEKFKFDHTIPESVRENKTLKLLWDLEIQTDYLISARQPDHIIINKKKKKKTCRIVDFAVSAYYKVKLKESEKKDKYLVLA